jgi:hypothetical protein
MAICVLVFKFVNIFVLVILHSCVLFVFPSQIWSKMASCRFNRVFKAENLSFACLSCILMVALMALRDICFWFFPLF